MGLYEAETLNGTSVCCCHPAPVSLQSQSPRHTPRLHLLQCARFHFAEQPKLFRLMARKQRHFGRAECVRRLWLCPHRCWDVSCSAQGSVSCAEVACKSRASGTFRYFIGTRWHNVLSARAFTINLFCVRRPLTVRATREVRCPKSQIQHEPQDQSASRVPLCLWPTRLRRATRHKAARSASFHVVTRAPPSSPPQDAVPGQVSHFVHRIDCVQQEIPVPHAPSPRRPEEGQQAECQGKCQAFAAHSVHDSAKWLEIRFYRAAAAIKRSSTAGAGNLVNTMSEPLYGPEWLDWCFYGIVHLVAITCQMSVQFNTSHEVRPKLFFPSGDIFILFFALCS